MKSVRIKEKVNAPYATDTMLRKTPCFSTTNLISYTSPINNNKYANVKSKYRTKLLLVNNTILIECNQQPSKTI